MRSTAVADLIRELTERGMSLEPAGPNIRVSPRGLLTDEDRARIRSHKAELLTVLGAPPALPPDDPISNGLRARLLFWGGPLGWPSLVEVGLGAGGTRWAEWLQLATTRDLGRALEAAARSPVREHPDPRVRLAQWAVAHQYVAIEGSVPEGFEAWSSWIDQAGDDEIEAALRTVATLKSEGAPVGLSLDGDSADASADAPLRGRAR